MIADRHGKAQVNPDKPDAKKIRTQFIPIVSILVPVCGLTNYIVRIL